MRELPRRRRRLGEELFGAFGDYTQQWDEASILTEVEKKGSGDLVLLLYGTDSNAADINLSVYDLKMRQTFTVRSWAHNCRQNSHFPVFSSLPSTA